MAGTTTNDDEENEIGIFNEPEDFYQPEKESTTVKYEASNGRQISLRLVGHSPLWVGNTSTSPQQPISSARADL